jgi:hypothetical protein
VPQTPANSDQQAIDKVLRAVESAWAASDFAALKQLWDTRDAPLYLAEEARKACFTWPELDAYWAGTRAAAQAVSVRIFDVTYRPLTDDLMSTLYGMHWNFQTRDTQAPVGGDVRVYALFRRHAGDWRFTQYIEAPIAPIVYMRTLYEQQVDPGFPHE